MIISAYGLKEDPFLLKSTVGEDHLSLIPFIPTTSYKVIEDRIIYHFDQPSSSKISLHLYFVGSIGVGKSTALLHLKKKLEERGFRIAYVASEHKTETSFYREITQSHQSYAPELKKIWDNTKSIVFFDVPDTANRTHLSKMASVMQHLLVKFKTSMVPVFNQQQYQRFQTLGTILGKFTPYSLTPFAVDDTMNMISKRLERARIKPHKDPLYPFSTEIVEKIHEVTQGNPRNTLIMCTLLLESKRDPIDLKILKKVSRENYILKILELRFQDRYKIGTLKQITDVIESEFDGCAPSLRELVSKVRSKCGWSENTIRARIKELRKSGVLLVDRNDQEPWRKDHRLVSKFSV
jgi:hypothetical protein